MTEEKNNKIERVLGIYTRLLNGSIVKKSEEVIVWNRYAR